MFFIKPAIEAVKTASQTLDAKEIELADLQKQIKEDEDLPQQCQEAYDKVVKTAEIFYPMQKQHEAMMEVQDLLDIKDDTKEQDIQNLDMSITTANSVNLARYVFTPSMVTTTFDEIMPEENAEENAQIESLSLGAYNMTFNFTAKKEDLLTFFDQIQNKTPRSLIIDGVEIGTVAENEDDTEWSGSISMEYIMIPSFPSPDDVDKLFANQPAETVDAVE
jgi:hypothetical protein